MNRLFAVLCLIPLLAACDSLPSWMGGGKKKIVRLPGEREDVLLADEAYKVDENLLSIPANIPAARMNSSWAQPTGEFTAATGNLALSGDFLQEKTTKIGEGEAFIHTLIVSPVIADGVVYGMDAAGYISAHKTGEIGTKIWQSDALAGKDDEALFGGGLSVAGDTLYAASGPGVIAALNAKTGTQIWKRDIGFLLRSPPRIVEGTLYITTVDSQIFALDVADGKTQWIHRGISEGVGLMNAVSPTAAADMVFVPYISGELYALKRDTGDEVWRASLSRTRRNTATSIFTGIGGNPVVDNTVVFAVSNGGMFSVMNILNGVPLWEKQISSLNTPWLAGDYIYVLTEENVLMAMVKYNGKLRWKTQFQQFGDEERRLDPIVWRGPVMVDGTLAVVSSHGELALVDAEDGKVSKVMDIDDDIHTAPIVAEGRMYLVGQDATLYEFQ